MKAETVDALVESLRQPSNGRVEAQSNGHSQALATISAGVLSQDDYERLVEFCAQLRAYRETHPKAVTVRQRYVAEGDYRLGRKVSRERLRAQRPDYPAEWRAAIDAVWPGLLKPVHEKVNTTDLCRLLRKYRRDHPGETTIPERYVTKGGYSLGERVVQERYRAKSSTYPAKRRRAIDKAFPQILDNVGDKPLEEFCRRLQAYREAHPRDRTVPHPYVDSDGYPLGAKLSQERWRSTLAVYGQHRRRAVHAVWPGLLDNERQLPGKDFAKFLDHLALYHQAQPSATGVPADYVASTRYELGARVARECERAKRPGYSTIRRDAIDTVWPGLLFGLENARFIELYVHLKSFRREHPDATNVPLSYTNKAGYQLGWQLVRERHRALCDGYEENRRLAMRSIWPGLLSEEASLSHADTSILPARDREPSHQTEKDRSFRELKQITQSAADLLYDAAPRFRFFRGAGQRVYAGRPVPSSIHIGDRYDHRNSMWRLICRDFERSPVGSRPKIFAVLGQDVVRSEGRQEILINRRGGATWDVFPAGNRVTHAHFWRDFLPVLHSSEFRELVAQADFESLEQLGVRAIEAIMNMLLEPAAISRLSEHERAELETATHQILTSGEHSEPEQSMGNMICVADAEITEKAVRCGPLAVGGLKRYLVRTVGAPVTASRQSLMPVPQGVALT